MILEVKEVTKVFGEKIAVNNVSFSVSSGKAFGLLGRNGAGKTTTIRIIMDFFKPEKGEVLFDGKKKGSIRVGYLPEERGLYPKKVILEQLVYIGQLQGMQASKAKSSAKVLLEKLGATEYMNKKLETLSKGNQQKIQLITALISEPDVIILDEPFSGLDPINSQILKDVVRENVDAGKLVIFSSHQMAQVEQFCDDICIMNYGSVVLSGNLKKIKRSYPRNRILIELDEADAFNKLKALTQTPQLQSYVLDVGTARNATLITLKEENYKEHLLNEIFKANMILNKFEVLEPTLEEIFVEKAADDQNIISK